MPEYSDETLLDVRSDSEFHEGHIDGALNLSADEFDSRIEDLLPDKQAPVVCYCRGGNRGALAADKLQQLGYTKVSSIEGGLSAFLSEGQQRQKRLIKSPRVGRHPCPMRGLREVSEQ